MSPILLLGLVFGALALGAREGSGQDDRLGRAGGSGMPHRQKQVVIRLLK